MNDQWPTFRNKGTRLLSFILHISSLFLLRPSLSLLFFPSSSNFLVIPGAELQLPTGLFYRSNAACILIEALVHFSMSAGIYSLPPELVANAAEYLDTEGLLNLRLSSHFLRDGVLFIFVKLYFHKRRHIVTLESLECLAAISRHAAFGRAIRTIAISDLVVGSRYGTEKTLAERDFVHDSGMVALYLTEVLKNAAMCRTVKIVGTSAYQGWGAAAMERDTGSIIWFSSAEERFRLGIKQSVIAARTRIVLFLLYTILPM